MSHTPTQPRIARLLAGLVLLAAALRFATLGVQSLDADEGFTAEIARKSLGAAMSQVPHTESSPPLYYALVWLWAKLFGTGEWGLRSLSALAGSATVPVVYAIGERLKSARVGLIAAALVAVSPLLVWYSQEARAYMLFMLLSAVGFLFLVRGRVALWALASAAALATHYFAAVVVVPMGAWLLWRRVRGARWAVGGVALAGLALLPLALYQADHVSRPWADALSAKDGLLATSQSFLVGLTWNWLIHRPGVIVLGLLAVAMAWRARRVPEARLPAGIAAIALVVPFALSLVGPKYFTPGNELAVWPLLAVVLAMGASRLLAAATCVLMLAITLAGPLDSGLQRENWRDLVHSLEPAQRGIVVLNGFEDTRVVRYYLRSPGSLRPVGEMAVLGRPREAGYAFVDPPRAGMRPLGVKRERKIAYARYAGPPALVPPRAYGRPFTGSLYQR
jgi:4-amino-4-deoxy-L-arabinose transferase-like glycosyltransferase